MTNDDIRKIAEGLGIFEDQVMFRGFYWFCDESGIPERIFNPLTDWRDTGLVLEALVNSGYIWEIENEGHPPEKLDYAIRHYHIYSGERSTHAEDYPDLKQAICQAYLNLIRGEDK